MVGTPQCDPSNMNTSCDLGWSLATSVIRSRPQLSVCTKIDPSGPSRGSSGLMSPSWSPPVSKRSVRSSLKPESLHTW